MTRNQQGVENVLNNEALKFIRQPVIRTGDWARGQAPAAGQGNPHQHKIAGSDYWLTSKLKRFIIQNVFNALLIPRHSDNPQAITEQMKDALNAGDSLIIFPEGTRNTDDNTILLPFKSGIYHLAKSKPNTEFVPIWIDNISRVLPKGKILPIPLLCEVHIGQPLTLQENEDKDSFLTRSREALLALRPSENDRSELCQNESEVQQNKGEQA